MCGVIVARKQIVMDSIRQERVSPRYGAFSSLAAVPFLLAVVSKVDLLLSKFSASCVRGEHVNGMFPPMGPSVGLGARVVSLADVIYRFPVPEIRRRKFLHE